MTLRVAIKAFSASDEARAREISEAEHLPLLFGAEPTEWDYWIEVKAGTLGLLNAREKKPIPFCVDFLSGELDRRRRVAKPTEEMLLRAVGVKAGNALRVLDLTAGWGRDAFLLANAGCQVTLLEASPIIALLLEDGLRRFFSDETYLASNQLQLIRADALTYLKQATEKFDVIYFDPLYPERQKSALVKKETQCLQALGCQTFNEVEILNEALLHTRSRVVLKRPLNAPFMGGKRASYQLKGKTTRFDVYQL